MDRLNLVIHTLNQTKLSYDNDSKELLNLTINEFKKYCNLRLQQTQKLDEEQKLNYDCRKISFLGDILPDDALSYIDTKTKNKFGEKYQNKQINLFYELITHQNDIILNKQDNHIYSDLMHPSFIQNNDANTHKKQSKSVNYPSFNKYKYTKHKHNKNKNNHKEKRLSKQLSIYKNLNQDLVNTLPSYSKIKNILNNEKISNSDHEDIDMLQSQNNNNNNNMSDQQ